MTQQEIEAKLREAHEAILDSIDWLRQCDVDQSYAALEEARSLTYEAREGLAGLELP